MAKSHSKPLAMALGATLAASMASTALSAENPFTSQSLESGYKVMAEGKCGEGKCGGKADKEGKCGEGKCGEKKGDREGKCGEGKCGGKAEKEGKCGEGKCGSKS